MTSTTDTSKGTGTLDRGTALKAFAGFAVAAALLYLFGRVVGWERIVATLAGADYKWIAAACASTTVCLVVWSKAWEVLLEVVDVEIPFPEIAVTYVAATFADYVTPFGRAGGGPFVAYVLSRDDRANFQDSLASIVTSDTLNLVPFFTFAAVGFATLIGTGGFPNRANTLAYGLGALFVLLPALGYLLWRMRGAVGGLVERLLRPVAARTDRIDAHGIRDRVDEFYGHLDRMAGNRRELLETVGYSFVGWAFFTLPLYFAALTLEVELSPLLVLFIVPASTVASFVPTPGGLGGVEAAVAALIVALTPHGWGVAAALALLYRVASYWYVLLVGGLAMFYVIYRS